MQVIMQKKVVKNRTILMFLIKTGFFYCKIDYFKSIIWFIVWADWVL